MALDGFLDPFWGCPGPHWRSLWHPRGSFGSPLGRGGPWGTLGDPGGTLGGPWGDLGDLGGPWRDPGGTLGGPWGDLGGTLGDPRATLEDPGGTGGLPWGALWMLLKIGRRFPSKCAQTTIVLFKNQRSRSTPATPGTARRSRGNGGRNCGSDPPSTRAGGQDDGSYTNSLK